MGDPPSDRISVICATFEQDLRDNGQAHIENYLAGVPEAERSELLQDLLAIELDYRGESDETLDLGFYLGRFPQSTGVVKNIFFECSTSMASSRQAESASTLTDGEPSSFLSTCHLFSSIPADVLESHMHEREFAAGESLMRQGEEGNSLMIIQDGIVEISTDDSSGKRYVIDRARRRHVLGEMSLLTSEPRTANVVAIGTVHALVLPADTFHELARQYPELTVVLTHLVAERLGKARRDALTDKVLANYRIKRRLGRGGMGVVYEAEDLSSHDRIALKMMSHRLVYCAEALKLFQREADIIESFEHRNIIRLLGRFSAFHTYFIVMEFCRGQTLQELLDEQGPLSETDFRSILGQLASAVVYAHRAKVIHRDIKPSNIMIDRDGKLVLMDFGLADLVLDGPREAGRIFGTPRYMPPEQRIGDPVDKEADYFSLGCVAYEMLTASPLFSSKNFDELTRDFSRWQPVDFRSLRPDFDEETVGLLQPALGEHPHERQLDIERIASWAGDVS